MNTAQKIKFSVKIFFLKYEQTAASTFAEEFLNGKLHLGKIKCDIFMAVHSLINIFQIIFQITKIMLFHWFGLDKLKNMLYYHLIQASTV